MCLYMFSIVTCSFISKPKVVLIQLKIIIIKIWSALHYINDWLVIMYF